MAEVKLSIEEYHNLFKGLNTIIEKLYEMAKEGNDYKLQRDELINDMAEVKRKAKAFDEIRKIEKRCYYVQYIEHLDMDKEGFESLEFIKNTLKVIRDFERGSDE